MVFTQPVFLLLLIPWIAVLIWVLIGHGEMVYVSTTRFWTTNTSHAPVRARLRPPPRWAVLVLSGLLCWIFYSSGFTFGSPVSSIRWVMDRQVLTQTALLHDPELLRVIDREKIVSVPDGPDPFVPTAAPTLDRLQQTVQRWLRESDEILYVVTSQALKIDHPRVQIIQPNYDIQNAGIQHLAITLTPRPQVMVRVWNQTEHSQAVLQVEQVRQTIRLPERGQTRDYFVDLPNPGPVVQVTLEVQDDLPVDNQAWQVIRSPTVHVQVDPGLPEPVTRFADVYQEVHVPKPGAPSVRLTRDPTRMAPVVVFKSGGQSGSGKWHVIPHPVTRWIDWEGIRPFIDKSLSENELSGEVVVRLGDRPLVAVSPGRVEIGFDPGRLADRPELVVLLANAIEWVVGEQGVYECVGPGELGNDWQMEQGIQGIDEGPGVYVHPTRGRQAVCVPAIEVPPRFTRSRRIPDLSDSPGEWVGPGLLFTGSILILSGLFCLTPKGRRVR